MMGLLWRSKRAVSSEGKRKGTTEASQAPPVQSTDPRVHDGRPRASSAAPVQPGPVSTAGVARPQRQHSVGREVRRAEQSGHGTIARVDDEFLAAVKSLEVFRSSPSNEADISVPLSNADNVLEPATIRLMSSQFDNHGLNNDRTLDSSDTVDAPSLSLTLGPAHCSSHNAAQTAARQYDVSDTSDALSLTLRVPGSAQRANTGSLYNQSSVTSNPRAATDSDVLEAPSLRLCHVEAPVHQTYSMDAEFNAHFTFPANVNDGESGTTAALTGDHGGPNYDDDPGFRESPGFLHPMSLECSPFQSSPSPVHTAAQDGDVALLQQLLQHVSDVDDLWSDSGTPLHAAVQGGSCDAVIALLNAGAAIDCVNGDGITPLMLAAVMGHEDLMLLLLERDADICKAFLPGSSEGLLHFCVEHEMVRGLKAVLAKPDGQLLATSTRLKPIYAALMSLAEVCTPVPSPTGGGKPAVSPGKVAAAGGSQVITKARSVVDLLLAHSDLPTNASYDDLIQQAHASYTAMETLGGSSVDTLDCLLSSADRRSSASPGAFDPESGRASSHHSGKRLVFTPTANLDCSPANCSPISVFGSERSCTPSAISRLGPNGSLPAEVSSPLLAGSASVGHSSSVGGFDGGTPRTPTATVAEPGQPVVLPQRLFPKKPLRVRTRIPE